MARGRSGRETKVMGQDLGRWARVSPWCRFVQIGRPTAKTP